MEDNQNLELEKNIEKSEGTIVLSEMLSAIYGEVAGTAYRRNVIAERDKLVESLNSFAANGKNIDTLKGDIAEYWHNGTFNLNAVQQGSKHRVFLPRSNDFASPDITSNFGKTYGLKYYHNGEASAKQQAKSIYERFNEYRVKGGKDSLEVFLHDRNYELCNINDPMYIDQIRIIPSNQVEEARSWLNRMIKNESVRRPEQAERYRETLKMLDDRIRDGKGTESIVLTKGEAERIARLAKEGEVTPTSIMLTDADVIKLNYVMKNAAKAGLEAAVVSSAVSLVINVYGKYKNENKHLSDFQFEDWKEIFGYTAFSAGTSAITASTLYVVGSYCEAAVPGVGALLMAVFGIASLIPDYVEGKMTKEEFIVEAEIVCIDAALILIGTSLGQLTIPIPGLGALIGAIASSIAIMIIEHFWGDELREVLTAFNEHVKTMFNEFEEIIKKLLSWFKDLLDKVRDLIEKHDENYRRMISEEFDKKIKELYKQEYQTEINNNTEREEIYE